MRLKGALTLEKAYPFMIAAVLAIVVLWLQYARLGDENDLSPRALGAPDFIADNILAVQYDEHGRQHYRLEAKRITHFPNEAFSILEQPRLQLTRELEHALLQANIGKAYEKQENLRPESKLLLSGSVLVKRTAGADQATLRLQTESLNIWPDRERVEGLEPVRITQGVQQAQANTLAASNLFGTLQLVGDARMTFIPNAVSQ